MIKRAVVSALIAAILMLSFCGIAAQAAGMSMQSTTFGEYSLYMAVWHYALPSVVDAIGKKPLLQLTVNNTSGKTLETVFTVSASYVGDGDWGQISGQAEFTPIMIPAGVTEYKLNTDTLTRETLMRLIENEGEGIQPEEILGDFASWEVSTHDFQGQVDEKRVIPRLVSLKFPPGRYQLTITAKYRDPADGIWRSLPADTHTIQIMDAIGAMELISPTSYDVVDATPQFRWRVPKLPTHVGNVDVRLTLMHAGRVIWQPMLSRSVASIGNKEDSFSFNFDKTASEVLVGGEEYSWYVELLDQERTGPGGLLPGRIIDGTTSRTETFKLPNTLPRATITSRPDYVREKTSFTFTAQYSDVEDAQLNKTTTRQWYVNGSAVGSANTDTLVYQFTTAGVYNVEYRVTDSHGGVNSDFAIATVIKSEPPVLSILSPTAGSYEVGSKLTLQAEVYDPDSNFVMLTVNANGANIYTQEFKGQNSIGSARSDQVELLLNTAGTYKITMTAIDSEGLSTVRVAEVKAYRLSAPKVSIISPVAGQTFVLGDEIKLQADAVDEKGESYPITWYAGNSNEAISGNVYRITQERTPLRAVAQRRTAEGVKQSESRVEVIATPNQAPLVSIVEVPTELKVGYTLALRAEASDPEGDIIELQWVATAPDGSQVNLGTGNSVNLELQTAGVYKVVVTATDVARAVEFRRQSTAIIQVLAVQFIPENKPPQVSISSPDSQTRFSSGQIVEFAANATDPDGDQLELIWRLAGADIGMGSSFTYQLGAVPAIYELDAEGYAHIPVLVIASDMKGGMAQAQTNILVKPLPQPHPVIGGISPDGDGVIKNLVVGDTLTLTASLEEELPVTYRWLLNGQEVSSGSIYTFTFTKAGRVTLVLEATNQFGLSGRAGAIFNVQANQPPELVIDGVDPTEVLVGTQVALTAQVIDAENNYGQLEWMVDGQPIPSNWYTDEAKRLSIRYSADTPGSYVITARVTDNVGQVAGDTITVVVREPVATGAPSVIKDNALPKVQIEQPRMGGVEDIIVGESVRLVAKIGDGEAGTLKVVWLVQDVAMAWSETKVAGDYQLIATEASIVFTKAGRYTLIARVLDELGGQTEAAVSVNVQAKAGEEVTTAVIAQPLSNAFLMAGTPIQFQADNVSVGAILSWVSDIVGPLGDDDDFSTTLPVGLHTISLLVNGVEADRCQVTVVANVELRLLEASVYEVGRDVVGTIRRADGTIEVIRPGQPFDLYEQDTFTLISGKVWVYPRVGRAYYGNSYTAGSR